MRPLTVFGIPLLWDFACCELTKRDSGSNGSPGFCTNVSLSYPGWEVTGFLRTNSRVDLQLVNNASPNITTSCSWDTTSAASPSGLRECNDNRTRFAYDSTSSLLMVNQTWTCDETNLTFVGVGNITLGCPLDAGNTTCSVQDSKAVPASLIAPVQIMPKPVPAPFGAEEIGCTRRSRAAPAWEVSNLYYQRIEAGVACMNPGGVCPPGRLYYGIVDFDLVNAVTGEKRHCGADSLSLSDLQDGDPSEWLACDAGLVFFNLPRPLTKEYETIPYFRFTHRTNTLHLNQTWYCTDMGDSSTQSRFVAYGAVQPALDPARSPGYIGNMTVPQVRVDGSAPTLAVAAADVREQELPPHTVQRPQAFGRSCTAASLVLAPTSFRIQEFMFYTFDWKDAAAKATTSYLSMWVTNSVLNRQQHFTAGGDPMAPGAVWYGCNEGSFSAPAGSPLLNCSFAFDSVAKRLSVREDWICADKDHEHP